MCPVSVADLAELQALKADPLVFAVMLGGVRTPNRTADELAEEIGFWGRHGIGIWVVRHRESGAFLGITGFNFAKDIFNIPGGVNPKNRSISASVNWSYFAPPMP